jgi:hypothetical protein
MLKKVEIKVFSSTILSHNALVSILHHKLGQPQYLFNENNQFGVVWMPLDVCR